MDEITKAVRSSITKIKDRWPSIDGYLSGIMDREATQEELVAVTKLMMAIGTFIFDVRPDPTGA